LRFFLQTLLFINEFDPTILHSLTLPFPMTEPGPCRAEFKLHGCLWRPWAVCEPGFAI